jgi:hypothetical protein
MTHGMRPRADEDVPTGQQRFAFDTVTAHMSAGGATLALFVLFDCISGVAVVQAQSATQAAHRAEPAVAPPSPSAPVIVPMDPPANVQAMYRDVVTHAVAEFDAGRFAEARALFLHAHELWPSARTLRTLGMTAFELRMYPRALAELQSALADPRRALPDDQRAEVLLLIEQTHAYVGRYRVQLSPAGAELLVDGNPAAPGVLVLALGDHVLVVRAAGHGELRRALMVQGREDEALALNLEPLNSLPALPVSAAPKELPKHAAAAPRAQDSSTGAPKRTPAFVVLGVGAAAVAVGAVAGVVAFGKKHDVNPESGQRAADISTIAFITAGVSAAIGTVLLLTASPSHGQGADNTAWLHSQGRFVRPVVGLGTIGLEGRI